MAEKQCSSSGCTKESCEGCPSKNKPTSFQVASNEYTKVKHVIGSGFIWRGIHLFQMLMIPHTWMKEPIIFHAPILNSHLYEKNDQLYLHICFGRIHT